jgi:hypothetical protein
MRRPSRIATPRAAIAAGAVLLAGAMLATCGSHPLVPDATGAAGSQASGRGAGTAATGGGSAGASPNQGAAGGTGQGGSGGGTGGDNSGASGTAGSGAISGGAGSGVEGTGIAGSGGAGTGIAGSGGDMTSGAAGNTVCPPGVLGHCSPETGPVNKYAGFTLALDEEFDQAIDLDNDPIWTWSDGGRPESRTRYNKSQISFTGGQMIITAIAMMVPSGLSYAEPALNQNTGTVSSRSVLSGELRTKYNNYRYGRYEVRYTAPIENGGSGASGNFLATMFTFRTPSWLEWREIDVMLEANIKGQVAYDMVTANGVTSYPGGDAGNLAPPGQPSFSIQMPHTYMIEWLPTRVTWYVDGRLLRTNNNTAPGVPTLSAKIMMDLWVFASAAAFGNPANNVYPFSSSYDWFRFYKWDMDTTYPVADPHTQLPQADTQYSQNNPDETGHYP